MNSLIWSSPESRKAYDELYSAFVEGKSADYVVALAKSLSSKVDTLHLAAAHGRSDIIPELKSFDLNAKNSSGDTALHLAALKGHVEVVQTLLDQGAETNPTSNTGTPLVNAAKNGRKEILELLLSNGANVKLADRYGNTALSWAVMNDDADAAAYLVANGANPLDVLRVPCSKKMINMVLQEVISARDAFGNGLLHLACKYEHLNILDSLVSPSARFKININDVNDAGETPLHIAALEGDIDKMQLLVDCGADIDIADNKGYTPLHSAIMNASYMSFEDSPARFLIEKNAQVNTTSKDGSSTPLLTAVSNNHTEIVRLLIKHGASVSNPDSLPLHKAAFAGHVDVVCVLLELCPSIAHARDRNGNTALDKAKLGGHNSVVRLLEKHLVISGQ